jgi:hypothetical protein
MLYTKSDSIHNLRNWCGLAREHQRPITHSKWVYHKVQSEGIERSIKWTGCSSFDKAELRDPLEHQEKALVHLIHVQEGLNQPLFRPWSFDNKACCDIAVAQINYPNLKHNTQDSIEQARGRSHEEDLVQIFMLYVMQLGGFDLWWSKLWKKLN